MIVVAGTLTFDPAKRANAAAALIALRADTLVEDGCNQYVFTESLETLGEFHVFEEWRDADAMGGHMGSAHMAAFMGAAGDLGITGTAIDQFTVGEKTKLM